MTSCIHEAIVVKYIKKNNGEFDTRLICAICSICIGINKRLFFRYNHTENDFGKYKTL